MGGGRPDLSRAVSAAGGAAVARAGPTTLDITLDECESMLRYALGQGMLPPAWTHEAILAARRRLASQGAPASDQPPLPAEAMFLERERPVDEDVRDPLVLLTRAHSDLSRLVAPAKPKTIAALDAEQRARAAGLGSPKRLVRWRTAIWHALGPVPTARQLSVVALILLALFVVGYSAAGS